MTKLNPTGSALIYSTYLGGSNDDFGFGIAVDGAGNAYVTGSDPFTFISPKRVRCRRVCDHATYSSL